MHDTLGYLGRNMLHRKYHQGEITFSMLYNDAENFVLPLSHDEVVHGKKSLLWRMPGTRWEQFANLRLLFAYQFVHPGKKLLFMGGEFGQDHEWNHNQRPGLEPAPVRAAPGRAHPGGRPQRPLPAAARPAPAGLRRPEGSSGSTARTARTASWPSCARAPTVPSWWRC